MCNKQKIQFIKSQYPLSRFLKNGDLRWPSEFEFLDARVFLFTTELYIHFDFLLERFSLKNKYKDGLLNHNNLTVKECSFCEIIISAIVFYLETISDHKGRIAFFNWTPIIILLFESPCSLFLFIILKQLQYPKHSVGHFLSSIETYLLELEKILVNQEKQNKVDFNSLPTKEHFIRVLNLVLDEDITKKLVDTLFRVDNHKLTSSDLKSLLIDLETLIKINPKHYF